ncbi:MAG: GDSL-type esterase/lipase family protein [Candidatus Omnitrophota bacterium]
MKRFLKILLQVCALVLAVLLLLEALLRLGGLIFLKVRDARNAFQRGGDTFVIMCVGESTTALGGSHSYPAQLETLLDREVPERDIQVINKGVPMTNTSIIARDLPDWLEEYRPDLVVAMMGINDHNPRIPLDRRTAEQARFYQRWRVYKLGRWFLQSWFSAEDPIAQYRRVSLPPEEVKRIVRKKYNVSKIIFLAKKRRSRKLFRLVLHNLELMSEYSPDNEDLYQNVGEYVIAQGWYDLLYDVIRYLVRRNHHHNWLNARILPLCSDPQAGPAVRGQLRQMIREDPGFWQYEQFLGSCYAEAGGLAEAERYFQRAGQGRIASFDPVTRHNYGRILEILKGRGIPVVLVQYPLRPLADLKAMVDGLVDPDSVTFVDNEQIFRQAVAAGMYDTYFSDRFAGNFGHCTPAGNRILAENIARVIREKIFPENPR